MGIEEPLFMVALFRADALTVFKLRYFNGDDAESLVIGGTIRQPKAALAAMHGHSLVRRSMCQVGKPSFVRYIDTVMVSVQKPFRQFVR
jgi:hypothetical protein